MVECYAWFVPDFSEKFSVPALKLSMWTLFTIYYIAISVFSLNMLLTDFEKCNKWIKPLKYFKVNLKLKRAYLSMWFKCSVPNKTSVS